MYYKGILIPELILLQHQENTKNNKKINIMQYCASVIILL